MTHLAVTRLSLNQFRSYARAEIDADARPVALFGPNGAGKTNVLEALSLLTPGRGLRRAGPEDIARAPDALGWRVAAEIATAPGMREVELRTDLSANARSVRIDGKAASRLALGAFCRMVWLTPAMDRLWIEGAGERRRFLDRMTLSFFPDHGEAATAYERAMRDRNRLLKDDIRDDAWFTALETRMGAAGARLALNRALVVERLTTAQVEAETAFPRALLTLTGEVEDQFAGMMAEGEAPEQALGAAADALTQTLARGRGADRAAGRTLSGPHRSDLSAVFAAKGVEAKLCSTGEQKALLISLILANARALIADMGAAPILLLDEVAAHLDANRRAALFDEICALKAQAWMTGAGAELFDALGERAQRFSVSETDAGSVVAPA